MTHIITAVVPTPMYRPGHPVFGHHDSTAPTGPSHRNGDKGRTITVTSESPTVATEVAHVIAKVLQDVRIDGEPIA